MADPDDEKLMAFADGELAPAERIEVEAAINASPELRSRLEVFLRTKDQLAGLYNAPLQRPSPDHLIDLVLGKAHEKANGSRGSGRHRSLRSWSAEILSALLPRSWMTYSAVAAVGLVLLTAGLSGWALNSLVLQPGRNDQSAVLLRDGNILARAQFRQGLETLVSGHKLSWSDNSNGKFTLKPVLTFRSSDKSICRQYELTLQSVAIYSGLACRDDLQGNWTIRLHTRRAQAQSDANGQFVPAAGSMNSVLDSLVDQIMDGDAMGRADEEALLRGWSQASDR